MRQLAAPLLAERGQVASRVSAYLRLGKVQVWQHWYGVAVAWSLLPHTLVMASRTLLTLLLMLVAIIGVMAATAAFDDVTGYRDGTDERNYRQSTPVRSVRRKPLLTGELTEAEAIRFGRAAALLAMVATVASYLAGGVSSPWPLVAFVVVALLAMQYSAGLRISYIGGGEALLVLTTAASVAVPYAYVAGSVSSRVLVEGLLLGAFLLQISAFSNTADARNDRLAGRRTVATQLSRSHNLLFTAAVFVFTSVGILAGWRAHVLPAWLPQLMVPVWAVNLIQLRLGLVEGRLLMARRIGFRAFDLGFVAMLLANVFSPAS